MSKKRMGDTRQGRVGAEANSSCPACSGVAKAKRARQKADSEAQAQIDKALAALNQDHQAALEALSSFLSKTPELAKATKGRWLFLRADYNDSLFGSQQQWEELAAQQAQVSLLDSSQTTCSAANISAPISLLSQDVESYDSTRYKIVERNSVVNRKAAQYDFYEVIQSLKDSRCLLEATSFDNKQGLFVSSLSTASGENEGGDLLATIRSGVGHVESMDVTFEGSGHATVVRGLVLNQKDFGAQHTSITSVFHNIYDSSEEYAAIVSNQDLLYQEGQDGWCFEPVEETPHFGSVWNLPDTFCFATSDSNDWLSFLEDNGNEQGCEEVEPVVEACSAGTERDKYFLFSANGQIHCCQTRKSAWDRLHLAKADVDPQITDCNSSDKYVKLENALTNQEHDLACQAYDVCICLGSAMKEENLANFALGIASLKPGGVFLCTVPNSLGAGRFEEVLAQYAPIRYSYSKFHSRVFGIVVPNSNRLQNSALDSLLSQWKEHLLYQRSSTSGLISCPGIFGWDKVDNGSQLLANYLASGGPEGQQVPLAGVGADIGSGNGYLSCRILKDRLCSVQAGSSYGRSECDCLEKEDVRSSVPGLSTIERLDLYEEELMALKAAAINVDEILSASSFKLQTQYYWQDVLKGLPGNTYDWIVMNPPFHQGHIRNIRLGEAFVRQVSKSLKTGGVLYMVANRNLDYADVLKENFSLVNVVAASSTFKVFCAQR